MTYVADAVMGSGKSSSTINYINSHPNEKFIYITPYLDEAERIQINCNALNFIQPSDKLVEFNYSKTEHSMALIKRGCNITSTHAMFRLYTKEMCDVIKEKQYILIIDESVEVFTETEFSMGDVKMLMEGGYVIFEDDIYKASGKPYDGKAVSNLFRMLQSNHLIPIKKDLYYWALPKDVLSSFKHVFVLTYLFDCQDLYYYMKLYNMEFKYIGVKKESNGQYYFTDDVSCRPDYLHNVKNLIHIYDDENLNEIGLGEHNLSVSWYQKRKVNNVEQLKNNVYNFMHNYFGKTPSENKMWATYKNHKQYMRGKGYSSGYTVFNQKATNELRHKTVLSYLVNIYATPEKIKYFARNGIEFDRDKYALSCMLQWIYRSAIRDGKEISVYIPSIRMRALLQGWLNEVSS